MKLTKDQVILKARQTAHLINQHEQYLRSHNINITEKPELKYPEFYDGYRRIVSEYDSILIHSMKGGFPDHLFYERAPNMEEREFKYLRANYKQITLPTFIDFTNSVYRAFNDGNWSVQFKESHKQGDDNFVEYIDNGVSVYRSLETWMKNILTPCKLRDAMGVIAIKPNYSYIEKLDDNGEVYLEIDDTKKPQPTPVYYSSKQVVSDRSADYYQILVTERSVVMFNGKKEKSGLIFEFYDDGTIWRVEQYGQKKDLLFDVMKEEATGLTYPSVVCLMGVPVIQEEKVTYQSPFLFCVDSLDLVVLTQSYLQAVEAKSVFPYRIMVGNECDFTQNESRCVDGLIYNGSTRTSGICPRCKGSGLKNRVSPLGELLIRPEEGKDVDLDKAFKYVSPEVHTLEFLLKEISRHTSEAREILHLGQTSNDKVQGSGTDETASGKWIDQKAHYSFIKQISDQVFYIYQFTINTIGRMRDGEKFENVNVIPPVTFELATEMDYLNQMQTAKNSGMPDFVVYTIMYKFLSSLYYNDQETMGIFNLIQNADRLLLIPNSEIGAGVGSGRIERWEEYLHISVVTLITELLRGNPKFFEQDMKAQIEQLQNLAKEKAPKEKAIEVKPVNIFE